MAHSPTPPHRWTSWSSDFGKPATELYEKLLRKGVIVRPMAGNGYPTSLRISVGTREENARCVAALKEVLAS